MLKIFGLVESYLHVVDLIEETKLRENGYTVVSFLEKGSKPELNIEDGWNPEIAPQIAVRNDTNING